jgi:hypothetical protein
MHWISIVGTNFTVVGVLQTFQHRDMLPFDAVHSSEYLREQHGLFLLASHAREDH